MPLNCYIELSRNVLRILSKRRKEKEGVQMNICFFYDDSLFDVIQLGVDPDKAR